MPTMPSRQNNRSRTGRWALQRAKSRFSELVRKAQTDGPQHVTVHGRDRVVLSQLRRASSSRKVAAFVAGQPLDRLHVDTVTVAEIRFGIEPVAETARRSDLTPGSTTSCVPCLTAGF